MNAETPVRFRSPHALAALAVLSVLAPATAQDLLVRARTIVLAPDATLTDGSFLVRDGKVAFVGQDIPADARARARTVDFGDTTIVPGFVLAATTLTRAKDLVETAVAFTPDLRVADAFDPWHEELLALAGHGVTSAGLSPSTQNVAGGIGALVHAGKDEGGIAANDAFVLLSLAAEARPNERPPTSLMGQRQLLRDAFLVAKSGVGLGPDTEVLRQVITNARPAFVAANSLAELNGALALADEFGFQPVLVGAREAEKVLPQLAGKVRGVVLMDLQPTARLAELELPRRLAEAGVPFCFAGDPARLRLSAALAVRHGLDSKTALAALTRTPALMLGQQALVGALRQGHFADFVVFRGDPLDLSSAHVATYVHGTAVHGAAAHEAATPSPTGVR
jgi:imidazolonepropionase-like amidohydrolase